MHKTIFASLLILMSWLVDKANACSIEAINKFMLPQNSTASFEQIKQIKALSRPLKSSGELWLSSTQQLVWQMQKPIKSTLVLDGTEVTQFDKNDKKLQTPNNAIIGKISQVFLNLIKGDFNQLETNFETNLECQGEHWKLSLHPKEKMFANLFSRLSIEGETHLSQIVIEEKRGDLTTLQLSQPENKQTFDTEKYIDK